MSLVGRGLGRKATAPALLVTAGLGLAPTRKPFAPSIDDDGPYGHGRRRTGFSDDELIEIAVALILSGALDG